MHAAIDFRGAEGVGRIVYLRIETNVQSDGSLSPW